MKESRLNKVQSALSEGMTQKQAAEQAGVGLRTVARWVKLGKVEAQRRHKRSSSPQENEAGIEYRRTWSAADLEGLFRLEAIPRIQLMLETLDRLSNWRMHEWIGRMKEVQHVPLEWRSAIGFLPLLARDINAPSLAALADLMKEEIPWATKELRRQYRRKARPIMEQALTEILKWLTGSDHAHHEPNLTDDDSSPFIIEDLYITKSVYNPDKQGPMEQIPATLLGLLLELMKCLPEVDRQNRRSLARPFGRKRASITNNAKWWCLTADNRWIERLTATAIWPEQP